MEVMTNPRATHADKEKEQISEAFERYLTAHKIARGDLFKIRTTIGAYRDFFLSPLDGDIGHFVNSTTDDYHLFTDYSIDDEIDYLIVHFLLLSKGQTPKCFNLKVKLGRYNSVHSIRFIEEGMEGIDVSKTPFIIDCHDLFFRLLAKISI